MSSPGLLMDVTIDGKPRKVIAVPSKQGWLYVFDRITGQPIWPMPETAGPASERRQRARSKRPRRRSRFRASRHRTRARTSTENDLIDFTPELRKQALENLKLFRWEQSPYVPPVGPQSKLLGAINIANTSGGVNWPGSGFDLETGIFYTQAGNSAVTAAKYDEEEFHRVSPEYQSRTACRAGKRIRTTVCVLKADAVAARRLAREPVRAAAAQQRARRVRRADAAAQQRRLAPDSPERAGARRSAVASTGSRS